MTLAISPLTMPAALAAADPILEARAGRYLEGRRSDPPEWIGRPGDPAQAAWLGSFRRRARIAASLWEIHRNATTDAGEHRDWLRREGWDAEVRGGGRDDLLLAATLRVDARWRQVGRSYRDGAIERVVLESGVVVRDGGPGRHPVVDVATQHPSLSFCFQQVDVAPSSAADLADRAQEIATRAIGRAGPAHLDFPMVDLRARGEAGSAVIGLRCGDCVVMEAAERMRLQLCEIGGRARAVAEIRATRSTGPGPRTIRIAGPFLCVVRRSGVLDPGRTSPWSTDDPPRIEGDLPDAVVFAAYVDRDAWRRPDADRASP